MCFQSRALSLDSANIQRGLNPSLNEVSFKMPDSLGFSKAIWHFYQLNKRIWQINCRSSITCSLY
ncbi:MAG: hypothetical protein AB1815_02015 [Bacillota bacterium]